MSDRAESSAWPMCTVHPSRRAPCGVCLIGFAQVVACCVVVMAMVLVFVALVDRCETEPLRPQPAATDGGMIAGR